MSIDEPSPGETVTVQQFPKADKSSLDRFFTAPLSARMHYPLRMVNVSQFAAAVPQLLAKGLSESPEEQAYFLRRLLGYEPTMRTELESMTQVPVTKGVEELIRLGGDISFLLGTAKTLDPTNLRIFRFVSAFHAQIPGITFIETRSPVLREGDYYIEIWEPWIPKTICRAHLVVPPGYSSYLATLDSYEFIPLEEGKNRYKEVLGISQDIFITA